MSGFYEPPPTFSSPFRARLLSPRWELVSSHLGRSVPHVLQTLYDHPDQVLRTHFRIFPPGGAPTIWLDLFLPMDEEAVAPDGLPLPPGALAFADDERGDAYVFVPDQSPGGDGPVYLRQCRDGSSTMVPIAPALSAFLAWERRQSD